MVGSASSGEAGVSTPAMAVGLSGLNLLVCDENAMYVTPAKPAQRQHNKTVRPPISAMRVLFFMTAPVYARA
jgi:hypothetical protein